jgi:hypothetical protein
MGERVALDFVLPPDASPHQLQALGDAIWKYYDAQLRDGLSQWYLDGDSVPCNFRGKELQALREGHHPGMASVVLVAYDEYPTYSWAEFVDILRGYVPDDLVQDVLVDGISWNRAKQMYDVIGDIHGHADELIQLLKALGYEEDRNVYGHPERKVMFLGDFIDRGPKIRQVLEIVRPMIEEGKAMAVMGNHELNALAYHTEDPECPGEFLRHHSDKNRRQHQETLNQLEDGELKSYLDWFRTLPMWLELDGLRVVHACWDEQAMKRITQGLEEHRGVTTGLLQSACKKENDLFAPVEVVLKGKEAPLPEGISFRDKEGHLRTEIRTRWYLSPEGKTYRTYALQSDDIPCELELEEAVVKEAAPYPTTAKPVFFGHYWLTDDQPETLAENVACLDYSVANGGFLCAYRWQGEQTLTNDNFHRAKK